MIAYYWPPSGGAGVQRWLKFVKYLRQFGWEPVVYTAENAEYPILDKSLSTDIPAGITVLKQPIWEPYSAYKRLIGQKKEERVVSGFLQEKGRKTFAQSLSLWIRGNIFIPDARRFWISPSVRYLKSWLKTNPVDVLVSTGPPHSMHLIARALHKSTGIPWLADFRDPWTNIDFAADLKMSGFAARRNASLEKAVLDEADLVTVVSAFMREEFEAKTQTPVHVITNGYDPDDFKTQAQPNRQHFELVHTGSLNDRRNQPHLWQAIVALRASDSAFAKDFRLHLVGKNDVSIRNSIEALGLMECTIWTDYLPHKEINRVQQEAGALLLSINNYGSAEQGFFSPKATLTGKLFEYLAASRPILMIGPTDSQAATVVREGGAGMVCGFEDVEAMKEALLELYGRWKNNEPAEISTAAKQFSRVTLTENMAKLLNKIAQQ